MFVHIIVVFLLMYSLCLCFLRRIPTRNQKEKYALGVVTLFPSLKDPFSKKGYVSILNLCIVYCSCQVFHVNNEPYNVLQNAIGTFL